MKSSAGFEMSMGDLPTGYASMTNNKDQPTLTRTAPRVSQLSCGISDELSNAIDVVGRLTEQAGRMAGKGANELAMSEALSATFGYMVAFFHHLAIDHDEPHHALAKAAAGATVLTTAQLDLLRLLSKTLGSHTT